MARTEAQATLANVLADQLARHEHGEGDTVVLWENVVAHGSTETTTLAWLDFERAGHVAALALVEVTPPEGWTGPTPIWTVRDDLAAHLPVDRADPADGSRPTSPSAGVPHSGPAGEAPPSAGPGEDPRARYARHRGLTGFLGDR